MDIRVMKSEDYDKLYELWMTIKGFGIRSRRFPGGCDQISETESHHQYYCLGRGYTDWCDPVRT